MAKINKLHKYAILWLDSQGWDTVKIAEELSITDAQVKSTIDKTSNVSKPSIKTASSPVGRSQSKSLMINESAGKTRQVSIMTKEASSLNDDLKKKNDSNKSTKNQNGIFRPFSE